MDKLNKWLGPVNTLLIVGLFAVVLVGGNQPGLSVGASGTRFPNGLSTDSTSPSAGQVRTTTLTVTGAATLSATSTVRNSPDGYIIGGSFTSIATTAAQTLYTLTGPGPAVCYGDTGVLYAKAGTSAGPLAPSLKVSVGTSTGSLPTLNLIASTTVASTTQYFARGAAATSFLLNPGSSIVGMIGDNNTDISSSTYYGNWTMEYKIKCIDAAI